MFFWIFLTALAGIVGWIWAATPAGGIKPHSVALFIEKPALHPYNQPPGAKGLPPFQRTLTAAWPARRF